MILFVRLDHTKNLGRVDTNSHDSHRIAIYTKSNSFDRKPGQRISLHNGFRILALAISGQIGIVVKVNYIKSDQNHLIIQ